MLQLLQQWDPILYLDLHVTDGAQFQPDVAVMMEPLLTGPAGMKTLGKTIRDAVLADLSARKWETSTGAGGSPVRSNETRRIKVRLSASDDGAIFIAVKCDSINASIRFLCHAAGNLLGREGTVGRFGTI